MGAVEVIVSKLLYMSSVVHRCDVYMSLWIIAPINDIKISGLAV